MLNQLHTVSTIADDHRRTLLAEADAFRLARMVAAGANPSPTSRAGRVTRFVRSFARRPASSPREAY